MTQGLINSLTFGGEITGFPAANQSAFNTLEADGLTPVFQADFVHGINTRIWQTPVATGTGAAVDTNNSRLRIQSGTGSTNLAHILNRNPLRYRPGQGTTARFTPIFGAGAAGNTQLWGVGTIVGGAIYDGYLVGRQEAEFGFYHYNRGVGAWYAQSDWNGDKCNGSRGSSFTFDPMKGTPFQIKYPYLGFGNIALYIQVPSTSKWTPAHVIQYANTSAETQLSNPIMHFMGFNSNAGNTINQTMYCGSVGVFISGERSYASYPKWAARNNKTGIATETNILALKNATTYNGVTNRGAIRLLNITVSSTAASNIGALDLVLNPTIGGSPSYSPRDGSTADNGATITSGNSCASFDIAGTTITGGQRVFSTGIENPGGYPIDMTPYEIYLAPGDVMAFAGSSGLSSQIGITCNWAEDT